MSYKEPEDVYNMDETRLYFRAHSNNTLAQGKVKGWKLQKECVTLALDVNLIGTDKLKLLMSNHNVLEGGNLMSMFSGTQIKQLG